MNQLYVAVWVGLGHLKRQMPDETKREQLTPKYTFGCKRVVKSSDYYPALALSHVTIHSDDITEIKDTTIVTATGKSQKLDVSFYQLIVLVLSNADGLTT